MKRPLKPGVLGAARFAFVDDKPVGRLRLDRWWDATLELDELGFPGDDRYRPLVIIGMNPSDAGADEDDNTSAKCITFARREGANGLVMVNPHPGISTNPKELCNVLLPVGCDDLNWQIIDEALSLEAVAYVAAWGKGPPKLSSWRERTARVVSIARDVGRELSCFGANEDGSPKHPLYLPTETPIVPWRRSPS